MNNKLHFYKNKEQRTKGKDLQIKIYGMKRNKCKLIALCTLHFALCTLHAQTPLTPGDTMFFNNGYYYYNLSPGTYYLFDDGGPNGNYSPNIQSQLNLYAPNCEIYVEAGVSLYYPGDWFVISNACGDDVRHSSTGSPWSTTCRHYLYTYARLSFKSDASSQSWGVNGKVVVAPIDTNVYNIQVTDVGQHSATITWGDTTHTSWKVQYAPYGKFWGTGSGTGAIVTTDTTTITLTGLSAETHYAFFVYPENYVPSNATPTSPNTYRQYYYRCNLDDHPNDFTTLCSTTITYDECFNFTNLTASNVHGTYGTYANPYLNNGIVDSGANSIKSRHTVHYAGEINDPRTLAHLRTTPICTEKAVRLGNWGVGAQAESISFDFTVDTSQNDLLIFRYAALLQDPGHTPAEQKQPKLIFKFLDAGDNEIDAVCYSAAFIAHDSLGWNKVAYSSYENLANNEAGTTLWKDWTYVGVNLDALNGQTIKIQVTNYDCSEGGHYGYAYLHFACTTKKIYTLTCSDNDYSFVAPPGFTYEWYEESDPTTILATTAAFVTTVEGTYYCRCSFIGNPGCNFTLSVIAKPRYPLADFSYTQESCSNEVTFTNLSGVSSDGTTLNIPHEDCDSYYWDFGDGTNSTDINPTHIYADTGTYVVQLVAKLAGDVCTDSTDVLNANFSITINNLAITHIEDTICKGKTYNEHSFALPVQDSAGIFIHNRVEINTETGCKDSIYLHLMVRELPTYSSDTSATICAGDALNFPAPPAGSSYTWTPTSLNNTMSENYSVEVLTRLRAVRNILPTLSL